MNKCISGFHGGHFCPTYESVSCNQQFIRKLDIKGLIREEKWAEQHIVEEIEAAEQTREEVKQKNGISSQKRKKGRHGEKLIASEEEVVDVVTHKHLLMLVHAPMQFEVDEINSSSSLGFREFEQEFEVVCALSFSPPKSHPNKGDKEFSYFKQFGKAPFHDKR